MLCRLRRLLEARLSKGGKREYVQVLRLLETFSIQDVEWAILDALHLGTISFDAVKHLLLCRIERRPPRLDLENYPHLPLGRSTNHAGRRLHGFTFAVTLQLAERGDAMSGQTNTATADTPQVLLEHHLKQLRLPTFLREYDKVARQCAAGRVDYPRYLLRLTEQELLDRERRATERRIHQARFPVVKSLDTFEFLAIPAVNKALVLELARCEFLLRRENVLLLGNSGTGKTHLALALGQLAGDYMAVKSLDYLGLRQADCLHPVIVRIRAAAHLCRFVISRLQLALLGWLHTCRQKLRLCD